MGKTKKAINLIANLLIFAAALCAGIGWAAIKWTAHILKFDHSIIARRMAEKEAKKKSEIYGEDWKVIKNKKIGYIALTGNHKLQGKEIKRFSAKN